MDARSQSDDGEHQMLAARKRRHPSLTCFLRCKLALILGHFVLRGSGLATGPAAKRFQLSTVSRLLSHQMIDMAECTVDDARIAKGATCRSRDHRIPVRFATALDRSAHGLT
jgi:hypothetical protein